MEFTTEPFRLDGFPEHARAARAAAEAAGLSVDVGPFGTSAVGPAEQVLGALEPLVRQSIAAGASRVSLQVSVVDAAPAPEAS